MANSGVGLDKIEAAVDGVLKDIRTNGVTDTELERAKKTFLADYIYESDNQASLARRYGWGLAVGRSIADIEGWPEAISKVTTEDVKKAADNYLDVRHSATGLAAAGGARGQWQRRARRAAGRPLALVEPLGRIIRVPPWSSPTSCA